MPADAAAFLAVGGRDSVWRRGLTAGSRTVALSTCDVRPLERSGCHQGDSTAVEGWVPGSVQGLSPPRRASRVTAGCEARGQGPRTLVPSEGYRLGKSGRVNANESSMMPRQASSRRWVAPAGGRDWPQQSGRRRLGPCSPAGSAPPSPGFRGHPTRSHLAHAEHDNPDEVLAAKPPGKSTVRKANPQRAQEDPTSQCRRPKGGRKPGAAGPTSVGGSRITGRIGADAPTRKGADVDLVSL